jgi:hypothetical protein
VWRPWSLLVSNYWMFEPCPFVCDWCLQPQLWSIEFVYAEFCLKVPIIYPPTPSLWHSYDQWTLSTCCSLFLLVLPCFYELKSIFFSPLCFQQENCFKFVIFLNVCWLIVALGVSTNVVRWCICITPDYAYPKIAFVLNK